MAKKDRIREWIQNSVIEEDDEINEEDADEENIKIRDNQNGPIGERDEQRGPVSDRHLRSAKIQERRREHRERRIMKQNATYKPPVDPRIPLDKQKLAKSEPNTDQVPNGSNAAKDAPKFGIMAAMPFQNVQITNSHTSSENTLSSSDSNNTLKFSNGSQNIDVKKVASNGSLKDRHAKYK